MQAFDCAGLFSTGAPYSREYENYLNFFRLLAHAPRPVACSNVPDCWEPFVRYLGHEVASTRAQWDVGGFDWGALYAALGDKRRAVEIASVTRPELVHALYCADTEWPCPLRRASAEQQFAVTCNGSLFRDEVRQYLKRLERFVPERRRAVLVPCSADKPYPSPLHRRVQERLDRGKWHLVCVTGVLGLVPEELWGEMPHYDAGLPNVPRAADTVAWYFRKHAYQAVVVYSDFYADAIRGALAGAPPPARACFVLGTHYRDRYENLELQENLYALDRAVAYFDRESDGELNDHGLPESRLGPGRPLQRAPDL